MRDKKASNRSVIQKGEVKGASVKSQGPGIVPVKPATGASPVKAITMPKQHGWQKGKAAAAEKVAAAPAGEASSAQLMNAEEREIENWIESVQFKRQAIGGLDEADVWKKIRELHELYEQAISAERARCDAMVEHYRRQASQAQRQQARPASQQQGARGPRSNDPRASAGAEARGL